MKFLRLVKQTYGNANAICMFFFGFSSGLPLLLVFGTLSFWLREAGIEVVTIGFMSWIGLIYALKWLWAPMVDNITFPFFSLHLGRRRTWMLLAQIGLIVSIFCMGFSDPADHLSYTIIFAILTAFFSATQDIALDAYRIESAPEEQQAALAAMYQAGYRVAMIWSGAGAMLLASFFENASEGYTPQGWSMSYSIMAASMGVGVLATLWAQESPFAFVPQEKKTWAQKCRRYVLRPLKDFFVRFGWKALFILLLIATYRISDVIMGVMANPFYSDMGFSKEEVASVSKIFGVLMTIVGAFIGGLITAKLGVVRTLFLGGILAAGTNLLFSYLAMVGHNLSVLIFCVSADNLAGGIASAAFLAYLSGLTSTKYTATQYALMSSLMLLVPKALAGFSGVFVQEFGYNNFFLLTALLGIPVLFFLVLATKK